MRCFQEPLEELILLAQHVVIINMPFEDNSTEQLKKILDQLVNFYCECNTDEIKVVSYGMDIYMYI